MKDFAIGCGSPYSFAISILSNTLSIDQLDEAGVRLWNDSVILSANDSCGSPLEPWRAFLCDDLPLYALLALG